MQILVVYRSTTARSAVVLGVARGVDLAACVLGVDAGMFQLPRPHMHLARRFAYLILLGVHGMLERRVYTRMHIRDSMQMQPWIQSCCCRAC
jgi:hypothetical protein